ncbi:MAG: MEMO1 family protein [Euryarchaeota archaeon]|nr:MEMO1 family protein [Euryarchaeota archaeon]
MRSPAVAGQFYPASREALIEQIERCFLHPLGPGKLPAAEVRQPRSIIAGVVPHAGYIYSGYEAAHVYHALALEEKPESVVLLGPNHTGMGSLVAVSRQDWETPLGAVRCDSELAEELFVGCDVIDADEVAHAYEHSIEVQLPFLQYIYGDFEFVAISLGLQELEVSREIASCLARVEKDILILASSDFTHYESASEARRKDMHAIEAVLALDEELFMRRVYEHRISACGYGAIAAAISAAKKRGASRAELLKYGNSGDVTGDYGSVVAYAGIVFRR